MSPNLYCVVPKINTADVIFVHKHNPCIVHFRNPNRNEFTSLAMYVQYAQKYPYTWKSGDNFRMLHYHGMGMCLISIEASGNYAHFNT